MEKNKDTKQVIIACVVTAWLLSLVVVAQCAIRETNHRRPLAPKAVVYVCEEEPSPFPTQDYNTTSRAFEVGLKVDLNRGRGLIEEHVQSGVRHSPRPRVPHE